MSAKLDAQWAMEPPTRFEIWRLMMAFRLVQASDRAVMFNATNGNSEALRKEIEALNEHERSLTEVMDMLLNEAGETE